ncbi:MAG: LysR family transcriptional regulator [Aerococcus sp.]|nr:LysR family transcriptional regulator [Aerococcus sp.]
MNLYHLRYFATLAKYEHYTQAARKLRITQPTLSNAIQKLEEELGAPLFERSGRNIQLTRVGTLFLKRVELILELLDDEVRDIQLLGEGKGPIRVATLRELGKSFVPSLCRRFLVEQPDAEQDVQFFFNHASGLTPDMLESLERNEIDVAFCSKLQDAPENVIFVPVFAQEFYLAVPDQHPLAKQSTAALNVVENYPFVHFIKNTGLRDNIDQLFREHHIVPHVTYEASEDDTIMGLVEQGFGITIMPKFTNIETYDVTLIPLHDVYEQRLFYMAYTESRFNLPIVNTFVHFVRQHYTLPDTDVLWED